MVTFAMRRYTAEIYRLQEERPFVSLSDLADQVDASPQAASRMIARLRVAGFVEHEPYRGVRLTAAGEQICMPALRRHRLVEVFLVRVMKYGWDEVHELSDLFEKGLNQELEDRIFELAGRPTRCPHGEPIPSLDGSMRSPADGSLVDCQPGREYRISRVRTHHAEKLRYLGGLGLTPGVRFKLVDCAPFNGPLQIVIGEQERVLGYDLAATLFVVAGDALVS